MEPRRHGHKGAIVGDMLFLCGLLVPMNGLMHHSGPLSCLPLKARPRQNGPRASLSLSDQRVEVGRPDGAMRR